VQAPRLADILCHREQRYVGQQLSLAYDRRQIILERRPDSSNRWSALLDEPRSALYDQVAMNLAQGVHSSEMTFAFCDAVVNDLYGVITSTDEHCPALFWDVFIAFDEGQYYHGNNRDEDPVEVYTRPMIARIVGAGSGTS
jgi:hypothetical protein